MPFDLSGPPDPALLAATPHLHWVGVALIVPRWWAGQRPLEFSVDRRSLQHATVPPELVEAVHAAAALEDRGARVDLWVTGAAPRRLLALQVHDPLEEAVPPAAHLPVS
ncbi:hypothetical protein [Deinococcus rufus]|uniref:Uncharacterized protein n=1 Tax=Deinococcus rufus TaxID=2136097 RepID=A0ABV7Z9N5_9DEIO